MTRSAARRSAPSSTAGPRWLFGAAILFQTALLGGIAGAVSLAVTTYADALEYGDLSGYPSRIEAFATAFVAILILWPFALLCRTHVWRKREHLTEPQIWVRLLVLCLPVYGAVCAYRLGRRRFADKGQRGTDGRANAQSAGGTATAALRAPDSSQCLCEAAARRVSAFHSADDFGPHRHVMRWSKALLPWLLFLLIVVGAGLWFFTMPYSFGDWWHAQFGVRYDSTWSISRADYEEVTRLVEQELRWREVITDVSVVRYNEVTIRTLRGRAGYWPLGSEFTVKRVGGRWVIEPDNGWFLVP